MSSWVDVTSDVPQGSVLGPVLFVLYTNDLPDKLLNENKLYADDSKIIAVIRDLSSSLSLQGDLDTVTKWTDDWLMRLNAKNVKLYILEVQLNLTLVI